MSKADPEPMRRPRNNTDIKLTLDILTEDLAWNACNFDLYATSKQIIHIVLEYLQLAKMVNHIEISLLLSNDIKLQELNHNFRARNNATNVLSFPHFVLTSEDWSSLCEGPSPQYLGDIAMSYETLTKEAMERDISLLNHFTHLLVHSVLHLLGFDHVEEDDAQKMMGIEIEILKLFDINNPY